MRSWPLRCEHTRATSTAHPTPPSGPLRNPAPRKPPHPVSAPPLRHTNPPPPSPHRLCTTTEAPPLHRLFSAPLRNPLHGSCCGSNGGWLLPLLATPLQRAVSVACVALSRGGRAGLSEVGEKERGRERERRNSERGWWKGKGLRGRAVAPRGAGVLERGRGRHLRRGGRCTVGRQVSKCCSVRVGKESRLTLLAV
ncbi:hypothetical protein BJ546DRAFT_675581 [Cryomyces antarcticus]